jgi:hypothetical protein
VAGAKKRTTALRMLLQFLIAEGWCASSLDGRFLFWSIAASRPCRPFCPPMTWNP